MSLAKEKLDSCPTAPDARVTVHTRVLHRACEKVGGVARLAQFLGVPAATLYDWLEGRTEPSTAVFLRAVDLIMPAWTEEDEALARSRMAAQPPRRPKG